MLFFIKFRDDRREIKVKGRPTQAGPDSSLERTVLGAIAGRLFNECSVFLIGAQHFPVRFARLGLLRLLKA